MTLDGEGNQRKPILVSDAERVNLHSRLLSIELKHYVIGLSHQFVNVGIFD